MKLFFSTTTNEINDHGARYLSIRKHLIKSGHTLVHDWLGNVTNSQNEFKIPQKLNINEYSKAIKSISDADAVIFESTLPSFSTGHLMTLALQQKKPTLVLWLDDSAWANRQGMIESIESEYLELKGYNLLTYKSVINEFLNKYGDTGLKHRFNLVIDDTERQYLDWLSYKTLKSRTRLIRDLLRSKITTDKEYSSYLSEKK